MASANYSDLLDLLHNAEEIPEGVETPDYSDFLLLAPGDYENPSRTIKARQKEDKTISFEITTSGGLFRDGNLVGGQDERTWVTTRLYTRKDRNGNPLPGKTSSAAEYLKKVGFDVKDLDTQGLIDAMIQSQTVPVGVFVSWENRTECQADGTYPKPVLKTRDFNTGSKDEPNYVSVVEKNGVKYEARHRIGGFNSIS